VTRKEIRKRLIQQLRRASSMELAALTALDPLVEGPADGGLARIVSTHRANARRHRERVLARLRALGAGAPGGNSAGTGILAAARGIARRRGATEEERLRQAVLMKQLEVATYDTVERLAERAGDDETARMAREARSDDEDLARRLARRRLRLQRRRR
jgi:ferritin-like metal-binding protein YciE